MTNKRNNPEAGYTLVGVVLIFAILAVLGTSLVMVSMASVKTSKIEHDDQAAFYIAEAGLNYKLNKLETRINSIYENINENNPDDFYKQVNDYLIDENIETYNDFEKIDGETPRAVITVEELRDNDTTQDKIIHITSKGIIGNQERTVYTEVFVNWNDRFTVKPTEPGSLVPPFTVFTSGQFTMGSGEIIGDIGTINTRPAGITFTNNGGTHKNGKIYVPNNKREIVKIENSGIKSEIVAIDEKYTIPDLPSFPEVPDAKCPENRTISVNSNSHHVIQNCDLRINSSIVRDSNFIYDIPDIVKFDRMIFNENYTLKINLGSSDSVIVVRDLNMNNGHIELIGSGNLTIFVTEKMTFGSGSKINQNGDPNRINIFYAGNAGTNDVRLAGEQKIFGSLYAKTANIYLDGSGAIQGNIFTGGDRIDIKGGSDNIAQLLLAPNGTVNMTEGGSLKGIIIAETFNISGGAKVEKIKEGEELDIKGPISLQNDSENENGGSGGIGGSLEPIEGAKLDFKPEPIKEIDNN